MSEIFDQLPFKKELVRPADPGSGLYQGPKSDFEVVHFLSAGWVLGKADVMLRSDSKW